MVPPLKNKITPTTSRLSIGGHQEQRPHGESFYEKARGTNLQWRARERPQSQPKTPQGNTRSPPASEAPLSRNLYNYDFPPRPTIPTTEEVLAELQDVTIQYINCADPTESAARRLRVTQGEQQNLMANTVAGIIEAATATANFIAGAPQNTAGPTIILPDPRAVTQDTVLVDSSCSHPVASAPSKRRGRPPGTKKMAASPKNLLGASSRKHNFARIQSSLAKNCDMCECLYYIQIDRRGVKWCKWGALDERALSDRLDLDPIDDNNPPCTSLLKYLYSLSSETHMSFPSTPICQSIVRRGDTCDETAPLLVKQVLIFFSQSFVGGITTVHRFAEAQEIE
ncbi:hypothetical protein YC2023_118573 [Brassica napus]